MTMLGGQTHALVYTITGEECDIQEDDDEGDEHDPEKLILKSKDPESWYMLIKTKTGSLPEEVKTFVSRILRDIQDPKEGTIDGYLSTAAAAYIQYDHYDCFQCSRVANALAIGRNKCSRITRN
ncbi:unnamed protein product [Diatraea saccharalis]|uniref:Uncharacterized protein n=1 Tax=Diatraea saccharalis TaxID=40085 RepID=A0A9N9QPJ7_9NEOP|nr:unnamed protein product [Diatraea saccharalis]